LLIIVFLLARNSLSPSLFSHHY
jgi:centrin-1